MIHIMNYGIAANDSCFTVGKVTKVVDKKTGEEKETISNAAYCSTIRSAFEIVRRHIIREAVKECDCNLEEAVKIISEKEQEFYTLLNKIRW